MKGRLKAVLGLEDPVRQASNHKLFTGNNCTNDKNVGVTETH